ncbi:hypothetical protein TWF696_001867 [Orbilia brochopaga]|uniref:BTB domain-containing protein n=1 Tax=Orbilia brochopaga TaxID=3140254 RepID=A0AAV9U6L9_9PEZI
MSSVSYKSSVESLRSNGSRAYEHKLVLDLPYVSDLNLTKSEAAKYEKLLLDYYEHIGGDKSDKYLEPVKIFLASLANTPPCVTKFFEAIQKQSHSRGASKSVEKKDDPADTLSESSYDQLDMSPSEVSSESFEELNLKDTSEDSEGASEVASEVASDHEEDADGPAPESSRELRLYTAPDYTPHDADFTINVGSGDNRVEFKVHTQLLFDRCPGFKMLFGFAGYFKKHLTSSNEPDMDPVAFDYVVSWIYGEPFEIPDDITDPDALVVFIQRTMDIGMALYLYDYISDIAAKLAVSFSERYWESKIILSLSILYDHLIKKEKPIPFTHTQLTAFVRRVHENGRLDFLDVYLDSLGVLNKYPASSLTFFRDMALAISAAWQETENLKVRDRPAEKAEADSIVYIESPGIQSQASDDNDL